jgi:hypothetical protein
MLVFGSLLAASCGGDESGSTTAAPFHAIPDDSVAISGTAACTFGGGAEGLKVECELDMSDPRVSGAEIHDGFSFFAEGSGGRVWVAEEASITNADGTWSGSAQAAEDYEATPSGEAHYAGEGAYEGLEFHYYFFHADLSDEAQLRGWISGGE